MNKSYIFKENNEEIEFVGDFDGLYAEQEDPWHQSGNSGDIKDYYFYARKKLGLQLKEIHPKTLLEVGCGLGYTTKLIQQDVPDCRVEGMDISGVAIEKARKLFPELAFSKGSIADATLRLQRKYEVIILNQLLWYVLGSLDVVFNNCFNHLTDDGRLIISQAFFKSGQKYGKNICDGFDGLLFYLKNNTKDVFEIEYYEHNATKKLLHDDGLFVLRKTK